MQSDLAPADVPRLDDEFTKSLQNIDPHTTDYVDAEHGAIVKVWIIQSDDVYPVLARHGSTQIG